MALFVDSLSALKPQSVSAVVVALAGAIALLYYGQLFFVTLIMAVIIAFILEPFVILLMRARLPRALASFIVCVGAVLFLYVTGLGLYTQVASISRDLPSYSERIVALVDTVTVKFEETERAAYRLLVPKKTQEHSGPERGWYCGSESPACSFPCLDQRGPDSERVIIISEMV